MVPECKAVRQTSRLARDSYGADFSAACVERDALGLFQLAQLKTDVAPPGARRSDVMNHAISVAGRVNEQFRLRHFGFSA